MAFYTFNVFAPSGAPVTLDIRGLPDDGAAFDYAQRVLARHPSCDHVDVWNGARRVAARHRDQPVLRPIAERQMIRDNLLRYPGSHLAIKLPNNAAGCVTIASAHGWLPAPGKRAAGSDGQSTTRCDGLTEDQQQPQG